MSKPNTTYQAMKCPDMGNVNQFKRKYKRPDSCITHLNIENKYDIK